MNDYNFELNKQALLFYIYATGFVRLENGRGNTDDKQNKI